MGAGTAGGTLRIDPGCGLPPTRTHGKRAIVTMSEWCWIEHRPTAFATVRPLELPPAPDGRDHFRCTTERILAFRGSNNRNPAMPPSPPFDSPKRLALNTPRPAATRRAACAPPPPPELTKVLRSVHWRPAIVTAFGKVTGSACLPGVTFGTWARSAIPSTPEPHRRVAADAAPGSQGRIGR